MLRLISEARFVRNLRVMGTILIWCYCTYKIVSFMVELKSILDSLIR